MTKFEKDFKTHTGTKFNDFYNEYYENLVMFLNKWTKDQDLSEDIASEALMQGLKKIHKFDSTKAQLHTWVFKIAENMVKKHYRESNKLPTVSMDKEVGNNATLEIFLPYDDAKKELNKHEIFRRQASYVKKSIYNLPEKQHKYKTVLILREIDAMSYDEIAEYLNLNLSTVKSQIKKGREIIMKNTAEGLAKIERIGVVDFKLK